MIFTKENAISNKVKKEHIEKWVSIANITFQLCEEGRVVPINDISFEDYALEMANASIGREPDLENGDQVRLNETFKLDETSISDLESENGVDVATVRIIQGDNGKDRKGWSLNNVYYSAEMMKSLVPLLSSSRKMYVDHQSEDDRRSGKGRSLNDWAATVKEAWEDDSGVYAKIEMADNQNKWVYEAMKKHPEEVGVSIDAIVEAKKGKMHGKEGLIPNKWIWLNSSDFVTQPAAQGGVVSVGENLNIQPEVVDALYAVAEDFYKNGKVTINEEIKIVFEEDYVKRFEKSIEKSKFYTIWSTGEYLIYSVINNEEKDEKEKKNNISEIIDVMKEKILELNLVDLTYGIEQIIKRNKEKEDDSTVKLEEIKKITLTELKEANSPVIEELKTEMKAELESNQEVEIEMKELKESNESMKKDLESKDSEIKKLTEGNEDLKEKDRVARNKETIAAFIKENEIDARYVPSNYIEVLSKNNEDDLKKALDSVKEEYEKIKEDFEKLPTSTDKTTKTTTTTQKLTDEEIQEKIMNATN